MSRIKTVAITSGDPAGIGPEVIGKGLRFYPLNKDTAYIVYGQMDLPPDYSVISSSAELTGTFRDRNKVVKIEDLAEVYAGGTIYNINISGSSIRKGCPNEESGKVALQILERCLSDIQADRVDALLTGPVSKKHIGQHYKGFIGHTEFLAERLDAPCYVMNFVGERFSLGLITTHCPLTSVAGYITLDYVVPKIRLIHKYAAERYPGSPIALLSLNPHSGEGGLFGNEEQVLKDAVSQLQSEGIYIDGPFPGDSFFKYHLGEYRQIIAPYHDQGLIPFKLLNGESGVNTTLGLPLIRTSVDHGTAFDIAGKNIASPVSFISALRTTESMLVQQPAPVLEQGARTLKKVTAPLLKHRGRLRSVVHVKGKANICTDNIKDSINNSPAVCCTPYKRFAGHYDNYMSHVNWDDWFDFIINTCDRFLKKKPKRVLDCGCGTGLMADKLSRYGCKVEAIDLSPEMLTVAAGKNDDIFLTYADFLTPLPEKAYELVISLFDSLNYLLQEEQIARLLENISSSLVDKGLFIFDVSTLYNCRENFDGSIYIDETEKAFLSVRSEMEGHYQLLNIDLFENSGIFWHRSNENHRLRIYRIEEILAILSGIEGLTVRGLYKLDGFKELRRTDNIDNEVDRVFFVLQNMRNGEKVDSKSDF